MSLQSTVSSVVNAVASAPVVSPFTELLNHRTTIVIIVGVLALLGLPYVPNMTPDRLSLLTNVIIGAMGLLGVRFSVEGVMQTRADLTTLVGDVQSNVKVDTMPVTVTSSDGANQTFMTKAIAANGPLSSGTLPVPGQPAAPVAEAPGA